MLAAINKNKNKKKSKIIEQIELMDTIVEDSNLHTCIE